MTDAIIVALITAAGAIIAQLIISKQSTKDLYARLEKQSEINDQKLDAKLEKWQAVTDTKIENLTAEVKKHNNFAERIPILEERQKTANHRIDDLERKAG